jgi:penicillin-binding protein 1C
MSEHAGRASTRRRAALLALAWVGALASAPGAHAVPPSFEAVRAAHAPSDVTLLDRRGEPLQTLRVDPGQRRLAWVALEDVSPALRRAIVLSEDRRFWSHAGVDWGAVAGSAWANLWNTRTRGASTVTMQLAGLLDEDLARPRAGRDVLQKLGQAVTAAQLEARWSKSQILEAYLNRVPFRGELAGIDALSQTLFGKHPGGLDDQEAAIAAALVRAPNARPEAVIARACGLVRLQRGDCTGLEGLAAMALARRGGPALGEQLAPHAARRLLQLRAEPGAPAERGPLRSTLDAPLQRFAVATLHARLRELADRHVEDGAVVVLDNASGDVLAWVGSSGGLSSAADVDGVLARRQPGSTIKPFAYELAFERRLLTPASLLDDSPAEIATAGGLYLPQDYDHAWKGWVSARTALGASLNVPAVRVGALLGPDALHARLQALGFDLPEPAGYYGHALVLGSADVSLLALANAYRTLANGGLWSPSRLAASAPPVRPRRVLDAGAAWLVADILADDAARVRTFGFDSPLATRGWAAVKTGTSKDMRDNWCIGFTDRYTVGVWVGNASGAPMHAVSGVSGAAPLWQALVRRLHAGSPSHAGVPPAGVERIGVRYETAVEPPREEWFLAGTGAALQRAGTQREGSRRYGIASPRDGSRYAVDPDIPPAAQRMVFEGEAGVWLLDGRRIGRGERVAWAPWPGRHRLDLVAADGQTIETVRFEVRGASVKAAARRPAVAG